MNYLVFVCHDCAFIPAIDWLKDKDVRINSSKATLRQIIVSIEDPSLLIEMPGYAGHELGVQ